MKHYLLFCGLAYYPNGGWDDFHDSFDDLLDAVGKSRGWEWAHVVDRDTMQVIWKS